MSFFSQAREMREVTRRGARRLLSFLGVLALLVSAALAAPDPQPSAAPATRAAAPLPLGKSSDFVVLGYVQSDGNQAQYHWQSLTHVAVPFVDFSASGSLSGTANFTNRAAEFRAGGAAERNGVKVLLVLRNASFSSTALNTVMQSPALRATVIGNVVALLQADDYVAGVNLDLETISSSSSTNAVATANGIAAFIRELRAAMPPGKDSLSIYVGPTYFNNWGTILRNSMHALDFVNFSCYPWAGSFTSGSIIGIDPQSNYASHVDGFLDPARGNVPPEKMVLTFSSYGYGFLSASGLYGSTQAGRLGVTGFPECRFAAELDPTPYTREHVSGAEIAMNTLFTDPNYELYVYDDERSIASKTSRARAWSGSQATGRRLRGIGFWSLAWMTSNFLSDWYGYDPETLQPDYVHLRTYPHIYQAVGELLSSPGTRTRLLDTFEGLDPNWTVGDTDAERRDNAGLTYGFGATELYLWPTPPGPGAPAASSVSAALGIASTSGHARLFFRYRISAHDLYLSVQDRLATRGFFGPDSILQLAVHQAEALPGATARLVVIDAKGQLEQGPARSLDFVGWQTLSWNLRAEAATTCTTLLKAYQGGDGVLDAGLPGERRIAPIGLVVERDSATPFSTTLSLDNLAWAPAPPAGKQYLINEFRYGPSAAEFVEVAGPAGPLPADLHLRVHDSGLEAVIAYPLGALATIPDRGDGFGVLAFGDPDIPGVVAIPGWSAASDDLPGDATNALAQGIQLVETASEYVHDAVAYQMGRGTGPLSTPQFAGVTDNGYPWIAGAGPGATAADAAPALEPYSFGRYPDGANSWINGRDFTFMPASAGAGNGGSVSTGTILDFEAPLARAFNTARPFARANPAGAGGPGAAPGGGLAHRCIDDSAASAGAISVLGDAALGADGRGYRVTGELFLPASTDAPQAVAVGVCGGQGATFFSAGRAGIRTGESGYWLLYQNRGGVGLAGVPDAPGVFRFLHATNDNQDATATLALGAVSAAALSLDPGSEGRWVTFELVVNPAAAPGAQLVARVEGQVIAAASIPAGGPTRGPVVIGHGFGTAAPAALALRDGAWVDSLAILNTEPPLSSLWVAE